MPRRTQHRVLELTGGPHVESKPGTQCVSKGNVWPNETTPVTPVGGCRPVRVTRCAVSLQ
ncbi:hypothetical protein HaLaN_27514 [Haematococcus lacustris]|uniref:Uncharacterized protein n=1 Tax=Haematococcus lacustris TaxID=44745 RepID=A0A6A0A918_HAELA|nr:hypothetical protein HaLaN_27514 [Haematococcus lacustris]